MSSFNIVVLLLVFFDIIYYVPEHLGTGIHKGNIISLYIGISINSLYLRIVIAQIKSLGHYDKLRNNGGLFTYNVYHDILHSTIMYSVSINGKLSICTGVMIVTPSGFVYILCVSLIVVCINLIDCIFECIM